MIKRMQNLFLKKFGNLKKVSIAVSGGVDSLTLGVTFSRFFPGTVKIFHAVSPAVPRQATERLESLARKENWDIVLINAGEFKDRNYINNPSNRCFFCKTNLYKTIFSFSGGQILSGANKDDLDDYRPGLDAASNYNVRHPFIEAEMRKRDIRSLARELGLGDIAEIPSSPCLSSRLETGLPVNAEILYLINETETFIKDRLHPKIVRCRLRSEGIYIELDEGCLKKMKLETKRSISTEVNFLFAKAGFSHKVLFDVYKRGSAFLV